MTPIPPDGVTNSMLDTLPELDLEAMIRNEPEKASILIDSALKRGTNRRREAWVIQAQLLDIAYRHEIWRYHPASYNSLAEWLRDPEIGISRSLASEMIALMDFARKFAEIGIDVIQLILDVGPTMLRALIPKMRKAEEAGVLFEQYGPILESLRGTDMAGVIEMLNPKAERMRFDPEAVCVALDDGKFEVRFPTLNYDELEFMASKLKLRRWVDPTGKAIEPPVLLELPG